MVAPAVPRQSGGESERGFTDGLSIRRAAGDRRPRPRHAAAAPGAPGRPRARRPRRRARRHRPAGPAGQRRGPVGAAAAGAQSVRRGGAPVGDGRGRGGPARGVAAAVPVRLDLGRRALRRRTSCGRATTSWPSTSRTPRTACSGWGRCRSGSPARPTRPAGASTSWGWPGIAIGSRGGGRDLDDPVNGELWALLAERGTFVFLHPSGVPGPEAGRRLVHAAARRLPRRDRHRDRPHGVQRHAGAAPDPPVPGARRRLPAGPARADGHGLGAQGGRPDHAAAAERVRRPALLRHGGVQHDPAAAAGARTWVPAT